VGVLAAELIEAGAFSTHLIGLTYVVRLTITQFTLSLIFTRLILGRRTIYK